MNRKHHGTTAPARSCAASTAVRTILIVEDRSELRAAIVRVFADRACRLVEAEGVEEGHRLAVKHHPDMVLMDFNLRDGNGYELTRRLRAEHSLHGVPVVMLSGSPRAQGLGESLRVELSSFLKKPAPPHAILEACAKALGGELPEGVCEVLESPSPAPEAPSPLAEAGPDLHTLLDESLRASRLTVEADAQPSAEPSDTAAADSAPIVKLVNTVLAMAVDKRASDIHIEPQETSVRVRFRLDGVMVPQFDVPKGMASAIAARLKVLSHMNISERRMPQDGRFRLSRPGGKPLELRVSTLPGRWGEKVVLRLLGQASVKGDLAALGYPVRDLEAVRSAVGSPNGLILVTGPTGSGKTTTLYTMLAALNSPDRNIVTAEDPVEYELPGITQVGVRPELGLTFEKALRAFLRQDPDVMLVGEIRDRETAEIALKAASTGHLVLSSLHTNDAASTVTRLLDLGAPPYLAAASLRLVVAQRLVRVLCTACRRSTGLADADARLLAPSESKRLHDAYSPGGCSLCEGVGYRGRVAVSEVMPVKSGVMRTLIGKSASSSAVAEAAVREGMRPLRQGALALVESGVTSLAEAMKVFAAD